MNRYLLTALVLAPMLALAQSGTMDNTFYIGSGPNGTVRCMALQPDGKLIVGGSFTDVAGVSRNGIARFEQSGALDLGFDPGTGANGNVLAIELLSDGSIIAGGSFTTFDGSAAGALVKLNSDGSVNQTFLTNLNGGADAFVSALKTDANGLVLVGGDFTMFGGLARNRVVRIYDDGILDGAFDVAQGPNGPVYCFGFQTGGAIMMGGDFTNVATNSLANICRLSTDGSVDQSFSLGGGANALVYSLQVQTDDQVLIGGAFTSINGTSRKRIARLNAATGSVDFSFNPGSGAGDTVRAVLLRPEGRVMIAGDFTTLDGTSIDRIARLAANGSFDASFDPTGGLLNSGYCLLNTPDQKILAGSASITYAGNARPYIVRIYDATVVASSFQLTTPNFGGTFQMGTSWLDIEWVTTNFSPNHPINLELYDCGGSLVSLIASFIPNSGAYQWTIPNGAFPAASYEIRGVVATESDFSDNIDLCIDLTDPLPPNDPSGLDVIVPPCGPATLYYVSTPGFNEIWYWQGTSCGNATGNSQSTYTASTDGTYYLRAYNTATGLWSTGCGSIDVTLLGNLPTASGVVTIGGNPCAGCKVYSFVYPGAPGILWPKADSVLTDLTGAYSITIPLNADVVLQIRPEVGGFTHCVPTYGGNVHKWSTAQHILTTCDNSYTQDINVMTFPAPTGVCTFSGQVRQINSGKTQEEDPIPLIDVVIERTPPGNVTDMVQTDANGNFQFDLVEDNTTPYLIRVSMPGLPMQTPYTLVVNPGDLAYQTLDYCVDLDTSYISPCTLVSAPEPIRAEKLSLSVAPNPNNGLFTIHGEFVGVGQVDVVDLMGRTVTSFSWIGKGAVSRPCNLSQLPAGVYHMRLSTAQGSVGQKVIVE